MDKDDRDAQAEESRKGVFIYWFIPYAFLVLLHVLPGLTMEQPQVFPDELGYLGNARYLSGVAPLPVQGSSTVYHFGYSLFLVPAFWLFDDPSSIYKTIMVINGLLLSTFYFVLFYLLHGILDYPKRVAILAALVASLYPSFMLQSNLAWSENAFIPVYGLLLVLCANLTRRRSLILCTLFGLVGGLLFAVHPRALPVLPILIFFLLALKCLNVIKWRGVTVGIGCVVAGFLLTEMVNHHLRAVAGGVVDGASSVKKGWQLLAGVDPWELLTEASGQLLYLSMASFGIFVLGMAKVSGALWSSRRKALRRAFQDETFNVLLLLLMTSIGIFLASTLQAMKGTRADHIIYGRYNEGFVGLYFAMGLASLGSLAGVTSGKGWRRVGWVVLAVTGFALLAGLGRGPQILKGYMNPVNVFGIYPLIEIIGADRLLVISVVTCGIFIVLRALSILKIQYGMVFIGLLFLCVGGYDYYFHFIKGVDYLRESTMLAPHIRGLGKVDRIGYDMANYHPATWCGYQFLFPYVSFKGFDSDMGEHPDTEVVIAGCQWKNNPHHEALLIASGNRYFEQALWVLPPSARHPRIAHLH